MRIRRLLVELRRQVDGAVVLAQRVDVLDKVFFDDLGAERRRGAQPARVVATCVDANP